MEIQVTDIRCYFNLWSRKHRLMPPYQRINLAHTVIVGPRKSWETLDCAYQIRQRRNHRYSKQHVNKRAERAYRPAVSLIQKRCAIQAGLTRMLRILQPSCWFSNQSTWPNFVWEIASNARTLHKAVLRSRLVRRIVLKYSFELQLGQ